MGRPPALLPPLASASNTTLVVANSKSIPVEGARYVPTSDTSVGSKAMVATMIGLPFDCNSTALRLLQVIT